MKDYLFLAGSLVLFCIFHSLLISIPVTGFIKRKAGKKFCYYRLSYNIISIITLVPILYFAYSLKGEELYVWKGFWVYIQYFLILVGVILLLTGGKQYSFAQVSGMKQLKNECLEEIDISSEKLNTSGILGLIRHPWYTAVIILLWSRNLDYSALTVNIIFTLYLIAGTFLEERKLVKAFGDQYLKYRKEVSMFIPLKWIKKTLTVKR